MRLTTLSDYSLRVLMFLGASPGRLATIEEIARAYGISENHLMKVVHGLARAGFVETLRGRGGGMRLAMPAETITVGAVLRAVEEDFTLVECFGTGDTCRITSVCRLKRVLAQALDAYFKVLDEWTLAELVAKPKALLNHLVPQ
jgi:Rrf2 family transcriptional regulator, nitric oxide-sensitive transcriptional repressor